MTRHLPLAALPLAGLLLLTGCSMDEESFATKYAEQYCSYHDDCGTIEYVGGSYDECVAVQETAELNVLQSDACEYDGAAASDCIDELKDLSCPGEGGDDTGSSGGNSTPSCNSVCGG